MKFYKYLPLIILTIIFFNCEGPVTHEIDGYFENGNIKKISVLKGLSTIQTIDFSPDGNIERRSFYEDSYLLGEWVSGEAFTDVLLHSNYYNNGALKSKGYMVGDNLHGHWSYYNRDGELESNRYYCYGKPEGDWYSYHRGDIYNIVNYKYIKSNGNWIEYYKNGKIKESSFFNKKKISGLYEYYYKNGYPKIKGNYIDGKKDGEWNYYSENDSGRFIKTENYHLGLLDGIFLHYFENGVIKVRGQYKNNVRVNDWFWYFDINQKSSYRKHYSN